MRRGSVQPFRVVDHAQDRAALRRIRQQAQHRKTNEEPVGHRACAQPERGLQGLTLRRGQPIDRVEQRCAELVQPGERQLHLRLDAAGPQDGHVRSRAERVVEQRGLADPRLTAQDEYAATAGAAGFEQLVESFALGLPP